MKEIIEIESSEFPQIYFLNSESFNNIKEESYTNIKKWNRGKFRVNQEG